ncbi:MAG: ion channel [Pikeienuella sp.]
MRLPNSIRGSTHGSQSRRLGSYFIGVSIIVLTIEAILDQHFQIRGFSSPFVAYLLALVSVLYFLFVVVGVIFLSTDQFSPDPRRLAIDTVLSIVFTILSFSLIYRFNGISLNLACEVNDSADIIYFSTVTFSTLGYGDFRPCPDSRPFAALQAIIGNLHLGLIVGCAFFFTQKRAPSDEQ